MYCSSCGKEIADNSVFCSECGNKIGGPSRGTQKEQETAAGTRDQSRKSEYVYPKNPPLSPHLAWLCLVFAGLPQIIYGQVHKGLVLIVIYVFSTGFHPFAPLVIFVAAIIDAYMVGIALKMGHPVKHWEFFPRP